MTHDCKLCAHNRDRGKYVPPVCMAGGSPSYLALTEAECVHFQELSNSGSACPAPAKVTLTAAQIFSSNPGEQRSSRADAVRATLERRRLRDEAQQKSEPAWKQDGGKSRIDLIAPEMVFGVGDVLRFGAAKYAERNWERGMSWGRCFGAVMRHLWAWARGENVDPESGLPHLHHAACGVMFLIAYEARKLGTDDRANVAGKKFDESV
mgnify:CR=1 FL=1